MCGILAVFSRNKPITMTKDQLDRALNSLKHRGPDESGYYIHPRNNVYMGHTRLNVVDIRSGQQPHAHPNGKYFSVVNGEFYDYKKIRKMLKNEGHNFFSESDCEILVHLYEKYGVQCVAKLRGEFAFTLWDDANQNLVACRDRFGINPLYYTEHNGILYLSSEIKAFKDLGVPMEWDQEVIYNILCNLSIDPTRSMFKNIYQLAPGHVLVANTFSVTIKPYWNFDYNNIKSLDGYTESDIVNQFKAILYEAIGTRLIADVPIGCYLSGGLDSCALFGIASKILGMPIKPYILSFDHEDYDEKNIAMGMAKHVGIIPEVVDISEEMIADNFSDALWHSEYFFVNTHSVAKYLLSKKVRDSGGKVVLTGEGADEILAGYPNFRYDLIQTQAELTNKDKLELMKELFGKNVVSQGLLLSQEQLDLPQIRNNLGFVPSAIATNAASKEKILPFLANDFKDEFQDYDVIINLLNNIDLRPIRKAHAVHKSMYIWSKTTFPGYVLNVLGDRMEMAHSIEARVPFLDHKLVEYAQSLPMEWKIRNYKEKYILREAARDVLTDTVYQRQKHPFLAPPSTLNHKGALSCYFEDILTSENFNNVPFFNQKAVKDLLHSLPKLSRDAKIHIDPLITIMASLSVLNQKFLNG